VVAQVRGYLSREFDGSTGGLPIILDSQLIGAIGVAGAESLDAECARAGVAAVPGLQSAPAPAQPAGQQAPR
jgi:uncharacterized protein GlcG (DUF336 family)